METTRTLLVAMVVLFACPPVGARAGEPSFHHGVAGVRLPERVGGSATWSPDGKWIAVRARAGLRLRNVETGRLRELRAPGLQGSLVWSNPLDWSPDGKTIRYATTLPHPTDGNASRLIEVPLDGSEVRQQSLGVKAFETAWGPGGWPFAFTTGTYAWDFEKGPIGPKPALLLVDRFAEEPRRIMQIKHNISEAEIQEVQFSPDGKRIVFCRYQGRNAGIWTVRPDGSDGGQLWGGLTYCSGLNWSPHGGQLALVAVKAGSLVPHPYVLPVSGGKPHRLSNQYFQDGPIWSPDGRWLTFSNSKGEIRRVHPNGKGEQIIATIPNKAVDDLLWSPDGHHLAYTASDLPPPD